MIKLAQNADEIAACFPVMIQLRPHLQAETFVDLILELMATGYRLAYLREDEAIVTVAGYKVDRNLYAGKYLYVEDLVTCSSARSLGFGKRMLDWLTEQARIENCQVLHLDSGVQRFEAHRFYLRQRMDIVSHHFLMKLDNTR